MKWTDEATTEFIKLYMKHECLWNPEHPNYRIKAIRDRAFSDITENFNKTFKVSLCKTTARSKVKNLRTTYLQQLDRILEKSTPDYIHPPTLVWFEEMDKHMRHIRSSRHNTTNASKRAESLNTKHLSNGNTNTEDIPNENTNTLDSDPLTYNSDEEYTNVENLDTSEIPTKVKNKVKFKRKRKLSEDSTLKLEQVCENVQDEFEIYGKYIASQLRQMNLQNAIHVQLRIQTLISETRLSELTDICGD